MKIQICGKECRVYENEIAYYAIASSEDSSVKVEIFPEQGEFPNASVKPLKAKVSAIGDKEKVSFTAEVPSKLSVEFSNGCNKPVFVFLYQGREQVPTGENVIAYEPGEYDVGNLVLHSGETLFIPEGTVLHGVLHADHAKDVTVCGRGILDSDWEEHSRRRSVEFFCCSDVKFRDFTMTGANGWGLVLGACDRVDVDRLNIMSWRMCGDGIDVVGSHDVEIKNCFFRTEDDCIAVKAVDYFLPEAASNVYNVNAHDCVLWNAKLGNAIEIGFETMCDEIYNIVFSDLDIIHCEAEKWQSGAAVSIHCSDRATVHDIVYRDIRVEDVYDKFFDFNILYSMYSKNSELGCIRDVTVERVALIAGNFPPSLINGYLKPDSLVKNVKFIDVTALGKPILSRLEGRMVVQRAVGISFETTNPENRP